MAIDLVSSINCAILKKTLFVVMATLHDAFHGIAARNVSALTSMAVDDTMKLSEAEGDDLLITYRNLACGDLSSDLLDQFVRVQQVTDVWRWVGGGWKIVPDPFIDDWSASDRQDVCRTIERCLHTDGCVLAAYDGKTLSGLAVLARELIGSRKQYADLLELQVSAPYRRQGIGCALFARCAETARSWGAERLYISAHSAVETQAFYRRLGCVDAQEMQRFHQEREPFDCQLEFLLSGN